MKRLWLIYFPFLFLPNLGFSRPTPFGVLELSDFLIGPYLILLLISAKCRFSTNVSRLSPVLLAFLLWALVSTVTFPVRYDYFDNATLTFCVLKLCKFALYAVAGVMTSQALADRRTRELYDWSILGAGVVVGISLFIVGSNTGNQQSEGTGYIAVNAISVMMAILVCYIFSKMMIETNASRWQFVSRLCLVVMVAGFVLSDGRGGWIAALAGIGYTFRRLGISRRAVAVAICGFFLLIGLYRTQPEFKTQVDMTLFAPESTTSYQGTRSVGSIDDGGRFDNWSEEAQYYFDSPLLGTGFFHRGGNSPLKFTGSHNFFIQMFLEVGLVGGFLVIYTVKTMWKQANLPSSLAEMSDIPLKSALVAAILGGLSGEYFYGGVILFSLFAVYAPTGSMKVASRELIRTHSLAMSKLPPMVPMGNVSNLGRSPFEQSYQGGLLKNSGIGKKASKEDCSIDQ